MGTHDGHRKRMRQRFRENGLETFQEHEVLELLLYYAIPYQDTNDLAHRLLDRFGSLAAVCDADPQLLLQMEGVGENAATLLNLIGPLTRRYLTSVESMDIPLDTPERMGDFLLPRLRGLHREEVYMLCLDAKMKPLQCVRVNEGESSFVHLNLRHAVEVALRCRAECVVLAHNHTSGIAIPSEADYKVTIMLRDRLTALGIEMKDHLIVADDDFISLHDSGVL